MWIDMATEPAMRKPVLKTEAIVSLSDFNATAQFELTLPSVIICASPGIGAMDR